MENKWMICKKKVDELPADYIKLINDMQQQKPERVNKKIRTKGIIITCDLKPIEGFEIQMQMIKHNEKGVRRAWYIAWNPQKQDGSTCYIRDLMTNDPYAL